MIARLTLRGVRANKWRMLLTLVSLLFGVSFVSGSFILTDSLTRSFDRLFAELAQGIDFQVRSSIAFGDEGTANREPLPSELVDTVRGVEGIRVATPTVQRTVSLIGPDGDPVRTQGPTLAVNFEPDDGLGGTTVRDGRAPVGSTEMVLDKATADRVGYSIGDTVTVVGPTGAREFTLVGFVGQGDSDGFNGAALLGFDTPTALDVLDTRGTVDTIEIAVQDGTDRDVVLAGLRSTLPDGVEVITGEQVAKEAAAGINQFIEIFGYVLLGFAAVVLFVSTFLIFNTFAIIIGQRLRELALLRAVGATGRQVRSMLIGESLVLGVVATTAGIGFGVLVAKGIVGIFNAAGAGFPSTATYISPRTVLVSVGLGIGVTLLAALPPALRASRIPPVAAMRPEIGYTALQSGRRLVWGSVTLSIGIVLFLLGILVRPGGTIGVLSSAGLGAVLIFLGVTSVGTVVARPVAGVIGAPIARLFGLPGVLARDNARRTPRRTATTASALMVGLALVSLTAVVAASVKATFVEQLDSSVDADFFITDPTGFGLPRGFADDLAAVPELGAVSPFRATRGQVEGQTRSIGAVDPVGFPQLVDVDVRAGSFDDLGLGAVMLNEDPAGDLGVGVGDTVAVTWQNGRQQELTVAGIYHDGAIAGNWLISLDTLASVSNTPAIDFFVGARIADGVSIASARAAVDAVAERYPSVQVQDQAEFRKSQEDQLNQLLVIIYSLLSLAVTVAIIGIANTMALSVFERTREFGLLRAVGMERRQLRRSVRWEAVIVSVFGAVLGVTVGLPLGIGVAHALPDSVVTTLSMPYSTIVVLFVTSILVGLLAAVFPARRAAKLDILDAIATT